MHLLPPLDQRCWIPWKGRSQIPIFTHNWSHTRPILAATMSWSEHKTAPSYAVTSFHSFRMATERIHLLHWSWQLKQWQPCKSGASERGLTQNQKGRGHKRQLGYSRFGKEVQMRQNGLRKLNQGKNREEKSMFLAVCHWHNKLCIDISMFL